MKPLSFGAAEPSAVKVDGPDTSLSTFQSIISYF